MIDVSKIEAGQIDVVVDEFDLYDLCAEVAALVLEEARAKGPFARSSATRRTR